jgi:hypothetical protein
MGRDRDRRLLKRDELVPEVSGGEKIIHSLVGFQYSRKTLYRSDGSRMV